MLSAVIKSMTYDLKDHGRVLLDDSKNSRADLPPPTPCLDRLTGAPAVSDSSRLNIDELLPPIPGEQPAGDARAYAHRLHEQLDEMRREDDPTDYDEATRPAEWKRADWPGLLEKAEEALKSETKDLRVACHLVEALVRLEGLCGLRQGLELLRRMSQECWDRLNPPLEDSDTDSRAAPLANMLDDPVRGLCFPNLVRSLPILGDGNSASSFFDWKRLQSANENGADARRDAVLSATDPQRLETVASDAEACLAELNTLRGALEEKLGESAPGFLHLGEAITDCQRLSRQALAQLQPETLSTPSEDASPEQDAEGVPSKPVGSESDITPRTRLAAYQQIEQAADLLCRLEPHSPVPYLVKRAVEMGRQPFPQMIRQLVREENTLTEMYRELGIDTSASEPSPAGT